MPAGELPGRVDCLGPGVWAVAFPLSQGVAELLFESASCAAQALNLLRLRLCLGSPERANQAKELIAAVQAFAAQTDGSDVADWCNEEALQELKKHSLEDLVEMLTEEALGSGGDSGLATTHGPGASGVSEAAIAAIPSISSAAFAQEPVPAAAAAEAAAATMEESDFLGVAMCGGRWQAGFSLRLDAAAGRPCRQAHPQAQQLQAGSELEAALLRDLAVLWHGRWSALDPSTADAAAALPTVFNMPAKRYLYDAPLAAILAELPTWAELQAYLLQQQATGFLAAAAEHYHSDSQLHAAVWPDPESSAVGTSQLPPHSEHQLAATRLDPHAGEAPNQTAGGSAATNSAAPRSKRGRLEGAAVSCDGGGGASPGKRQRMGPVAAGLLQQQRQQAQRQQQAPQQARQKQQAQRQQQQGFQGQQPQPQPQGQQQAWRGYTGVNPVPANSNKWRALLSINTGSAGGDSTYRNTYVLEHSDPFVVAAARDVAMVWKVVVMGLDGRGADGRSKRQSLGILHAELRGDEELLAKLRTATNIPQLRTVLRQLLASGWLDQTSQTLRTAYSRSQAVVAAATDAAAAAAAPVAVAAAEGGTLPLPFPSSLPAVGGAGHAAAACRSSPSVELVPPEPPRVTVAAAVVPADWQQQAFSYTGVNWEPSKKKWKAMFSVDRSIVGVTSNNQFVLSHSDPFVAAAARDVAMVWKVAVMGQDGRAPDGRGKKQSLGLLHAELRGDEELLAKLRTATDISQLRTVLRQLLASGWLDQSSQTLRTAYSRSQAAVAPAAVAAAEGGTLPLPSPAASPAAVGAAHATACQHSGIKLPPRLLPDRLDAGILQQQQGQQQAFSYTGVNWHPNSNKWRAMLNTVTGSTEEASTYQKSSVLEHSDPFVVAVARDVAMVWKVMGQDGLSPDGRGKKQSLGLLHAELRGDEELLAKLRTATDVPQLRTVLRQLLASGWLDQASETLRTAYSRSQAAVAPAAVAAAEGGTLPLPSSPASPAASGPAHAAACRSSPSVALVPLEPPRVTVAATVVPADWQQRMEGWQQLAVGQSEAWARVVASYDASWLGGDGLGAMVTGGHAMRLATASQGDSQRQKQQQQQQQDLQQQDSKQQQQHQHQQQHSGATGGTTAEVGEQCTFPGASALLQSAASLPGTLQLPGPLLQLQSLLEHPHPAAAHSTVSAGSRPATPSAARAAAAAEAAASPPAVRVLPPAALPDVVLPVPGDVLLYCHNCSGVGGLPLLERLLVVRVLPLQYRRAGRSHACECLALARGAAAQALQNEAVPRPACVRLGLSGGKWRQAAVCRKARNWCITERVPRQRFMAVMAALAKLAQGQPSAPMAAAATASTASKPAP